VLSAYMASEVALLGLESFLHKRVTWAWTSNWGRFQ
jgi:hypothetical protein